MRVMFYIRKGRMYLLNKLAPRCDVIRNICYERSVPVSLSVPWESNATLEWTNRLYDSDIGHLLRGTKGSQESSFGRPLKQPEKDGLFLEQWEDLSTAQTLVSTGQANKDGEGGMCTSGLFR